MKILTTLQVATGMLLGLFSVMGVSKAMGQEPVIHHLFTSMQGTLTTAGGGSIPIWGYGWEEEGEISLPAPMLSCMEGDSVHVVMTNPSPESHTIHLHGLDVSQAHDGVPSTSFYVPTDSTAIYKFRADHSGTFLYHCHVTTTLHLTMGMYGMFVVNRPDGSLYEGGAIPDAIHPFLFSDLEVATNLNPTGAFPFHDIRPNYFMINGLMGSQLTTPEAVIPYSPGETLALRLASMAYSRMDLLFPAELNATAVMSDGRPLPEALPLDTLKIYPGERFTVLITPPSMDATGWDGTLPCEFHMMADDELEYTDYIHFNDLTAGFEEMSASSLVAFPNPTTGMVELQRIVPSERGPWQLLNTNGQVVQSGMATAQANALVLDLSNLPAGTYFWRDEKGQQVKILRICAE